MKPSIRTMDYVALAQDHILGLDEVPKDIQAEVSKWSGYFMTGQVPEEAADSESGNQTN